MSTTNESITITHGGKTIATLTEGQAVTLHTKGKKAKTDIVVSVSGEVKLISFVISYVHYLAVEGMTFAEWVDSEHNTNGWYISSDGLVCRCYGEADEIRAIVSVTSTDTIKPEKYSCVNL